MNTPPLRVDGVSKNVLARAYRRAADGKKLMPFRQHIGVEHDLLRLIQRTALTRVDRIFFALLIPRVVEIVVAPVRHRHVGLFEPPLDLLKKLFLEIARMRHLFGRALVLLVQVLDDLRIFPLAQPMVIIDAHMTVFLELCWNLFDHASLLPAGAP